MESTSRHYAERTPTNHPFPDTSRSVCLARSLQTRQEETNDKTNDLMALLRRASPYAVGSVDAECA